MAKITGYEEGPIGKLRKGSVDADELAPGAVNSAALAPGAVGRSALAADVAASIDRVDPGVSGALSQSLTIGPAGPTWLDDPVFNVKHPRFGAKGDNTTDDRAAIQAAINAAKAAGGGVVFFPKGIYRILSGPLVVDSWHITLRGVGLGVSRLTSSSGDLILLNSSPQNIRFEYMSFEATAGHVFNIQTHLLHCMWFEVMCIQYSNSHAILNGTNPDLNFIDNLWLHCVVNHTTTATMSTFNLVGWSINNNRWSDIRVNNSGNYTWWLECSKATSFSYANVIERVTGEVMVGGAATLLGLLGTVIRNFTVWDTPNATKDLFVVGQSTAGPASKQILFDTVQVAATTMDAGKYHVTLGGVYSFPATFLNCGSQAVSLTVNAGTKGGLILGGDVTLTGGTAMTVISPSNPGQFFAAVTPGRYTTAARPSAATTGKGAMIYDTTINKPVWSNGTAWTDATGTAV